MIHNWSKIDVFVGSKIKPKKITSSYKKISGELKIIITKLYVLLGTKRSEQPTEKIPVLCYSFEAVPIAEFYSDTTIHFIELAFQENTFVLNASY
jgi:hypothetical protein